MRTFYKPVKVVRDHELRDGLSLKLLARPIQPDPEIPADFPIIQCPARVAQGARKPRMSGGFKGAQTTSRIAASADRRNLLAYANKGMK